MRRRKLKHRLILLILTVVTVSFAQAENIRGTVAGTAPGDGVLIRFKPEELVVIELNDIPDYQEGLEIRLDIPRELRNYQNSFALLLFRNIQPAPTADNKSYSGNRTYMRLLPSRDSMFVRIPFNDAHEISGDALTDVLPRSIGIEDFPLMVTVLPVMKGIPDSAMSRTLSVSVSKLWKDEGTLTVNLSNPSEDPDEDVEISIDGTEVNVGEAMSVSAGLHRVRVESSLAPTVEKNIAVEPGEEAVLIINLDYRPPELTVDVPEGAGLLLDGEDVEYLTSPVFLQVEPGDHTVTYLLGDLEVSRDFTILSGDKVSISLILDIDIVEYGGGTGNPFGAGDG